MSNENTNKAADLLLQAWQTGEVIDDLPPDCKPRTIAEGHAVQDRLVQLLGHSIGGWKLAATSPGALRANSLDGPTYGRLFASALLGNPAELTAVNFHAPDIEGEFAFRMATDLPAHAADYGKAEVTEAVASLHLAVEIANSRYRDHKVVGFPAIIADNGGTGALAVGAEIPDWESVDIPSIQVSIAFDGEIVSESFTGEMRCEPLDVLVWLANELSRRGLGLSAGDVVTTGTSSPPMRATGGQLIEVVFEGFGSMEVRLN